MPDVFAIVRFGIVWGAVKGGLILVRRRLVRGDEGTEGAEAFGEDGGVFKGPGGDGVSRRSSGLPGGVVGELGLGPGEEAGVVGAEGKPGAGLGAGGEGVEQGGLEEAVLVVAVLGPGVGKEDEDASEFYVSGEGGDGFEGVGLEEGEVGELGAGLFALGAGDAEGDAVHAEAGGAGMGGGVGGEEMAVAAAEFEDERGGAGEEVRAGGGEGGLARGVTRGDDGRGGGRCAEVQGAGAGRGAVLMPRVFCQRRICAATWRGPGMPGRSRALSARLTSKTVRQSSPSLGTRARAAFSGSSSSGVSDFSARATRAPTA